MKRLLYLIPVAILTMAPGQGGPTVGGWGLGGNPQGVASKPWFEFAPSNGAGLPTANNLCDQLSASEKVGNWWCLNGDGTSATGGVALTADNTPTDASGRQCPNGPDCASVSAMRLNGSNQKYKTAAASVGTINAMTLCWLGKMDADKQTYMIGRDDSVAGRAATLGMLASGANAYVFKSGGGSTSLQCAAGTPGMGSVNLTCLAYNYVTDGTSVARLTVNGTACATSALAVGPILDITEEWMVGARGYSGASGAEYLAGTVSGAFYVPAYLDDARIAAIARAVLADAPTGAKGEALTLTRSTPQFCESSDGTGSLVPANRLCVTRGGTTAAQGSFGQYALRTEEIDNAAWNKTNTGAGTLPVVTQNYAVSPGGTLTAERIQASACPNPGDASFVWNVAATAVTNQTASVYLKGTSTSGSVRLYSYNGVSSSTVVCNYTASSWSRCSVTGALASGNEIGFGCLNLASISGSGDTGAADFLAWGANYTNTSSLRPYIPATSASVTTGAELPYFTLPANAPALYSYEATVDTPAAFTTNAHVATFYKDGTNALEMYVRTAVSNTLGCFFYVGGVAYEGVTVGSIPTNTSGVRLSCSYDGTNVISCINGTCNSTAKSFTMPSAMTRVYVGNYVATGFEFNPNYVIKSVKGDPNSARFR